MDLKWLCFRSLVEVLLGTGMRISEALSLTRSSVNFETGEARIIGKRNEARIIGKRNKERTVFFTTRALAWIKEFTNHRTDTAEWLFVLPRCNPPGAFHRGKVVLAHQSSGGIVEESNPAYIAAYHGYHSAVQWLPDWFYQRNPGT